MHLEQLKLTQFKNYESEHIQFSAKVNCIVGLNGMGKTNLLDAIYYLCVCKSQFGILDRLLVQDAKDFFRLEGQFKKNSKAYKVIAKVQPRKLKEFSINGATHPKLANHIGQFPVVMITPFDIALAMDGSEVRRRFLDFSISQMDSAYLSSLLKYNRVLRQRNAALKSFTFPSINHSLLDSLEEQWKPLAQEIFHKRVSFMESFLPLFEKHYQKITNGQEEVQCTYKSSLLAFDFEAALLQAREKDILLQRSTVGIHKDDLLFTIKNRPLKKFASQGQLKSFILALKLAQYELLSINLQIAPLLLLDDIFDRLDNHRVQQLVKLLFEQEFGQIFFTDTQPQRLLKMITPFQKDIAQFEISHGAII